MNYVATCTGTAIPAGGADRAVASSSSIIHVIPEASILVQSLRGIVLLRMKVVCYALNCAMQKRHSPQTQGN